MAAKRAEHERLDQLRHDLKYGRTRPQRPHGDVYGPGKRIAISMFHSPCAAVREPALRSFARSFLDGPADRVRDDLLAMIDSPSLFELVQALIRSRAVGLLLKLRLANSLCGQYANLARYKLGKIFISDLLRFGLFA